MGSQSHEAVQTFADMRQARCTPGDSLTDFILKLDVDTIVFLQDHFGTSWKEAAASILRRADPRELTPH